ncbi:hypothetical protein [Xenorhabdus japonica]|uniref:Cysteine dioxygenase type I n=1 Tax=Xenorhabdus japonica TaxID=53341 RepID=A0A1I5DCC5_9GAMM|nr:hypothetical protein [Xenorhabdus japonica]SFN96863.1 hypothetical protein SAMN05421579_13812 [Xenorhabdus japonica]
MLKVIENLAGKIEARWRMDDYSCYSFADIAKSEMQKVDLISLFSFKEINSLLNLNSLKKIQIASEFSELHMKLFDNGKFYIELLNWWDKDTSIHDHGFSGVLLQLEGSALNTIYSFDEENEVSHNLSMGNIKLTEAYISKKGDCRIIPFGRTEKHAVWHLEKPTISLIVRTHPITELSPQLNYFPPYIRINHSAINIAFNKKIKYFNLLSMIDAKECKNQLLQELKDSSATEQFWLMMKMSEFLYHPDNIDLLQGYIDASKNEDEKSLKLKLVSSVTLRRSSQFIINKVKPLFTKFDDRLFLSCLASSYNQEDRAMIFPEMGIENVEDKLTTLIENLPVTVKPKMMIHVLKTLGLNVESK